MSTKNKGEWGEFYVFLELLASGKLYQGDENLRKLEGKYFNIEHIKKLGSEANHIFYVEDDVVRTEDVEIRREDIKTKLPFIFQSLLLGGSTFEMPEIEQIASSLGIGRISAPSRSKADLEIALTDKQKITSQTHGFSVKTLLGADSTLVNASRHTKFVYKIRGCTPEIAARVNSIEGQGRLRRRLEALVGDDATGVHYERMASEEYRYSVRKIDSSLDEILGQVLLYANCSGIKSLPEIMESEAGQYLMHHDLDREQIIHKLKEFLTASSLGLTPSVKWNGETDVDGGMIMLTAAGEVLAYFLFDVTRFKKYLWSISYFDTPSMTRHDFGYCYEQAGEWYFDIVMQIRNK